MSDGVALVRLDVSAAVATITLDSPANRNALSRRLVVQLRQHLSAAAAAPEVRVIVLTHTGGTFCAGADMAEAVELGMEEGSRSLLDLLRLLLQVDPPVVAAVRGHVRAGGVGLVGACDFALVTTSSTFAFTEARLGLTPAVISLTTRSRLAERDRAHKFLTGERFDGAEAARSGLVTGAYGEGDLDAAVEELTQQLCKVSPQGLRETKRLLNRSLLAGLDAEGDDLAALSARLFASGEAREAMTAFRERRPPRWATSPDA